jgi:photosynthetic reaction center cytochrome c subunit
MSFERKTLAITAIGLSVALSGCEIGTKQVSQNGPRGTGMNQVVDNDLIAKAHFIPPEPYPLGPDAGPRASATYPNLQVLGDISTDEFNRLMLSINDWVVPKTGLPESEQGCNYCHNPENMASDEKYTKVVARRMVQMTRNINTNWQTHVKGTGVTCWTCHRGNAVPEHKWSNPVAGGPGIKGNRQGQNEPVVNVGYSSLPNNIFEPYLAGDKDVRVASTDAYRVTPHGATILSTEQTYGLMMRVSTALGVNCTYCHNAHSFGDWKTSTPQRAQAWHGIRMARAINNDYITPLAASFPANRLGKAGDPYKVNCMTCHQGVNKPLGGVSMLKDHPSLAGPRRPAAPATPTAAATPVAAAVAGGQ